MTDPATTPRATIVIPSHNRSALLRRILDALARQTPGTPSFEVVVVADGCRDDTVAMLARYSGGYPITVVERPGEGPAHARNAGAQAATTEMLIFLDDDVEPVPGFVNAHFDAQASWPGSAVIGPYPPAPHASRAFFRLQIRDWWAQHFASLADPGHRFSYRDLLTGNLSLSKALWNQVGGLDPLFARAREDLELGVRLMKAGVPFRYAPDALGLHHEHETATLESAFRRAKEEGRSDAHMALKHPDLGGALKIVRDLRWPGPRKRRFNQLVKHSHGLLDPLANLGPMTLRLLGALGMRKSYRRVDNALRAYWYRRGAIEALGKGWQSFLKAGFPPIPQPEIDIDIAPGLEQAEARLSAARPHSARILHGETEIGILSYGPASEPWEGRHLRPLLASKFKFAMLPFLMSDAIADTPETFDDAKSRFYRLRAWRTLGIRVFPSLLQEAQGQWWQSKLG